MLTGEIRNQVDRMWDAFWTGGISNPLEVIEQLTYLLFIKRLDEIHTRREARAAQQRRPLTDPIFGPDQQEMRWSHFKHRDARTMYTLITERVFPFMKGMQDEKSAFAAHMKDARFTLPPEKAGLLAKVVDMIDHIPMEDRDTKGDLYEYMLSKLATAGQNGQFRTPRHIIKMMVEMTAPRPDDVICDPACGTAGFLVAASEYLYAHYSPAVLGSRYYQGDMFHGFDFDSTMLRVASMNMLLHGVENPHIQNRDSLSEDHGGVEEAYSLILANPPFAGSLDYESTAKDLLAVVKTKKTELLFLALFLRLLKPGGRAAVIVPDGVLFGSSTAHKALRQELVERQKLEGIISMPSGVFKPYAGVSTAVLLFTKTNSGGTDSVWFYDMQADGFSLDDKRIPNGGREMARHFPTGGNGGGQTHEQNNIPDILARWFNRAAEAERPRTAQSFLVPKAEIAANEYDLSINRYKQIVYAEVAYDPPLLILDELAALEAEIQQGMAELREMLA
ncbi:MAG: DNA methyltransferase [Chloroflexota bacterium]|nr:MAG: DNA methyltransferase [Chloroflexota bacterium]